MGLGAPNISAAALDTFMCLSQGAFSMGATWTVIVLLCCAALGLAALARSRRKNVATRTLCAIGAALLLVLALAAGLLVFFSFSWCTSRRLF
jgi:multisubunit Na+/H+ antiporter MnhB subunit